MKTQQILLKSFTFFVTLALLFGDVSFASAKKKKKKGKKNTKFSKSSGKKNVAVNDPQPAVVAPVADVRAGYARGRGGGAQQNMTHEQQVTYLTDALMRCLSPVCEGSISYEKCFKLSKLEEKLATTPDCISYLNSAIDEDAKITAKSNVQAKIKGYLTEACKGAGGKPVGEGCKFNICYYAKSSDGKKSKLGNCMPFSPGQTVTCSYSAFGLFESDLQYELEMDAATKGELITAGLNMGVGVFQGGMKIYQANKTKKELETAEKGSSGCYIFNGSTLTRSGSSCPTGDGVEKCEKAGMLEYGKSCYYEFKSDVSKITIQEKTSELIRSKVNIAGLKQLANNEDIVRSLEIYAAMKNPTKTVEVKGDDEEAKKMTNVENLITDLKSGQQTLKDGKDNTNYASQFSSAVSNYNSSQGALNKSREELEQAGKDIESGITDLTQGVLGGGTQLITSMMAAKENKGTMTGGCYIGDPTNSGDGTVAVFFAPEGESKKISWK